MKYKLIDGSTFIIAGVATYTTQEKVTPPNDSTQEKKSASNEPHKTVKMRFDFDLPNFTFDIDKEAIKRDALRAKEAAMKFKDEAIRFKDEAMKRKEKMDQDKVQKAKSSEDFHVEDHSSVDNTYNKEGSTIQGNQAEEESTINSNQTEEESKENNPNSNNNANTSGVDDFSKYMNEFGKYMSAFGDTMGEYGKNFGKTLDGLFTKDWVNSMETTFKDTFGKNLDGLFTKDWVSSMENTFKDLFGEDIDRHWSGNFTPSDYKTWQQEALFNELYENNPSLRDADLAPDVYYEVQGYDLGTKMNEQLSFIGCQVKSSKGLPYSVVTHRSSPEQWLVVKLTEEEFNADWMKVIETLDVIKDYSQYPYFILRHFKHADQQQDSLYKIYIPLKDAR